MNNNRNTNFFKLTLNDLINIDPQEATNSEIGTVFLVRSNNVPERGDHYILIKGGLTQKMHGIRPEVLEFPVEGKTPLDEIANNNPIILLKLNDNATNRFYNYFDVSPEYRKSHTKI